jgi:hypothetical protein
MENKTLKTIIFIILIAFVSIILCEFLNIAQFDVSDSRWKWIKSKVFSKKKTIDFVAIGSSYIWCALKINPIIQQMNLNNMWNLGRNWAGRDVDYIILKKMMENHDVQHVLLQFHYMEPQKPHAYVKYVISPIEACKELNMLKRINLFDKQETKSSINTILSYWSNLSVRVYLHGLKKENKLKLKVKTGNDSSNGFYIHNTKRKHQKTEFERFKNRKWRHKPSPKKLFSINPRSAFYIEKIHALCLKNNTKLSFLFIPVYFGDLPSKSTFDYYNKMGDVLIPDISRLDEPELWRNPSHLLEKGAEIYTEAVISLLKSGKESSPFYHFYVDNN